MSDNTENQIADFIDLASDIVCAYVSNNSVPSAELGNLIHGVHATLAGLANGAVQAVTENTQERPTPAQIRKSVQPDGIISFLDGKTYKTMKRHLGTHGLTPASYRQRFGLPADYPMVAASYAAQRSALAKSIGLGRIADRDEEAEPKAKVRGKAV